MSTPRTLARSGLLLGAAILLAAAVRAGEPGSAPADSGLTLTGDAEGSVLRALTVEGENRIRFDFARPELAVDLDPAQAPGLVWGDAKDVLDRTVPDRVGPLVGLSTAGLSPYRPRPWLAAFQAGPVARFRPQTEDLASWELSVVDARGEVVRVFAGRKDPPAEIAWDGRDAAGEPVLCGLTYSYVFTAQDRAGNRRRLVGDGFAIDPYRLETDAGPLLILPGDRLDDLAAEVASWLNRRLGPADPVRITATAPQATVAEALGQRCRQALLSRIPGDPARVLVTARVQAGAPRAGSLRVEPGGD